MPNKPTPIKRSWVPERKAFGRRKDNSKFYNSRAWRKFTKWFKEKYPYCKHCADRGIVSASKIVDHIEGLDNIIDEGRDPLDENECQGLCVKDHNIKSGKEAHGYREKNWKKNEKN